MNKPIDEKQFEVMVRDCAEFKFLQYFTLLGRKGELQYGGDVASQDWKTIIQCKCYDQNKGKASYDRLMGKIKDDYENACGHFREMNLFVVATTLDRDLPTQEAFREFEGDIPIQTLFWEDLVPLYKRFEEKYRLKEIRLALDKALIRDRDNHPSFRLMKADELDKRLLPTYEAQEFEPRTEQDGIVSPVWSRIQETWQDGRNRSLIIEGAGGIGKTVALFTIPMANPAYAPPPAIYIPMYRLVDEKGDCQTIPNYFAEKFSTINSALDHVTRRIWEEGPGLLLLLDGFNEIPSDKRRTILRHINDWRKDHPGAQIIVVSRPMDNIDLEHELAGEPLPPLKLKPLDEDQARGFLSDRGLEIPATGPIWKILSYPLFLVLYAKTGCLPQTTGSGYPLNVRESTSGGALIWNYLQRELLRDDREDQETWVIRCAVACEFILPVIAYEMVRNHQFSIRRTVLFDLIEETVKTMSLDALPNHLGDLFDTYENRHPRGNPDLASFQWIEVILRETGLLLEHLDRWRNDGRRREEKRFRFLHQNFRDCLAGIYLVNQAEVCGENELPEVWKHGQSHLALKYAAELMDADTANRLWSINRNLQQYKKTGYKKDHTATCALLELQKKRKFLPIELDFSGMDLRGLSLTRYLGKSSAALSLFKKPNQTKRTIIGRTTFQSDGHRSTVDCVTMLPNGRVISGSNDSTLRVWDADTGQCLQTLAGHRSSINCVCVLLNGRVVSGSHDRTLMVWDVNTGQCLQTLVGHRSSINCVVVLPNGRVISGSHDRTLMVWDADTGQCLQTLEGHTKPICCVAVLPDGRVVSGSDDSTLRVWDTVTGQCLYTLMGHRSSINYVAVLPNERVVSGSNDSTLRVWDVNTGHCLQTLEGHKSIIYSVVVLADGRVVSGSNDSTLRVWDTNTGQCLQTLEGHKSTICSVADLEDGRVVSGSDDSILRVWNASTGQCLQTLEGHRDWIRCVAVLPDKRVASGSYDSSLRVWDADTGQCLQTLEGNRSTITSVAILPNGQIVSGSYDSTLHVWDNTTNQCLQTLEGHRGAINCVAVLPNGQIISGSNDSTLRVWDAVTGQCLQTMVDHKRSINCLAVLQNERIVIGSHDSTLRVWDTATGQGLQTLRGHKDWVRCVAVLPDGRVVSGSDDHTLRVWDTATGRCLHTLKGHTSWVHCVASLSDGRIVSGSDDHTLRVWDVVTGECLQTLKAHSGSVTCLAVLQNGRVVSGSTDRTIRVWDIAMGLCLQTLEESRGYIFCLAVLQDGRVISGSEDSTLRVWDLDNGECLDVLESMEIRVSQMDFSEAILSEDVARLLWQNGAQIPIADYKRWIKPYCKPKNVKK